MSEQQERPGLLVRVIYNYEVVFTKGKRLPTITEVGYTGREPLSPNSEIYNKILRDVVECGKQMIEQQGQEGV